MSEVSKTKDEVKKTRSGLGVVKYFQDVVSEMKKVTWPTRNEVVSATVLVVVFSIIMALVVFGIDEIISRFINLIH